MTALKRARTADAEEGTATADAADTVTVVTLPETKRVAVTRKTRHFILDVESMGLYGEAFAFGVVAIQDGVVMCSAYECASYKLTREFHLKPDDPHCRTEWIKANVVPALLHSVPLFAAGTTLLSPLSPPPPPPSPIKTSLSTTTIATPTTTTTITTTTTTTTNTSTEIITTTTLPTVSTPETKWTSTVPTVDSLRALRDAFWQVYETQKTECRAADIELLVWADCGYPVETHFFAACVADKFKERQWEGPYPLHEVATLEYQVRLGRRSEFDLARLDLLKKKCEDETDPHTRHHPLQDTYQSARWLYRLFYFCQDRT